MGGVSTEEIREALRSFLQSEVLAPGVSLGDDDVLADLGVDSFSLMEVVLFAERRWGAVLPMASLTPDNVRTVRSIGDCLAPLVGG